MPDLEEIIITHVDSPSKFFFRYAALKAEEDIKKERKRIDSEIRQLAGESSSKQCIPAINSIYGFLHHKWMRWIRVRIKEKEHSGAYLMFLLDFGHNLSNGDISRFIELPDRLKDKSRAIQQGSLGLRPSERVKSRDTKEFITKPVRYYDAEALRLVQDLKESKDSSKVFFVRDETTENNGTLIGNIIVKTMQETYNVRERLLSKGLAMREDGIEEAPVVPKPKLVTNSLPVANFEKIIEAVCPQIPKKLEQKPPKSPIEVAAGVQLGVYTNKRKEGSVPTTTRPTSTQPTTSNGNKTPAKPASLPQPQKRLPSAPPPNDVVVFKTPDKPGSLPKPQKRLPSAPPPNDVVVFGQHLLAPLKSIESAKFNRTIQEQLRNNLKVMSKVQGHCWPHIAEGRSMIIVGRNKSDLNSPYLPPILDLLQSNRNEDRAASGIGPIAVIVTKSSSDVKRIAQLCSRCTGGLDIVEVYGVDSKFEDVMNGCDLMIATAPAFMRMTDGISFKVFDKRRIKHVVFDCADEMLAQFQSEINEIIRKCTYGRLKAETNPQIIVTANNWIRDIEPQLMSLIHQENLVVCFENFFEAAAFVRCFVGMEFMPGIEEKSSKLKEILLAKTNSYISLRTAVVTNDNTISRMLVERLAKASIQTLLAHEVNCKAVKLEWCCQLKDSYSVLITSDSALKQMELTNVQHLIHFSIPKGWESFTQRFASMIDQFYRQIANKELKTTRTTILLDDENSLEFTQLVKFLKSRSMNVSAAAVHAAKMINDLEENSKIEGNVAICTNVWLFGECNKPTTCSSRHMFADCDKPAIHIPTDSFIKFDIVLAKSPTSYAVKIRSHLSGTTWISWDEKNREIEKTLEKDLQEFFNISSNCKPANKAIVGLLYAVKTNDKWFRCRLVEKKLTGTADVNLIDDGRNIPCVVAKLVHLPELFKKLDPLVHNLFILNLVPFDHEQFYDDESRRIAREMIAQAAERCTFMCKVRMAIQDSMFTDDLSAKDDETGSLKIRMKSKLLKQNVCSIDDSVEGKLRNLFSGHQSEEEKHVETSPGKPAMTEVLTSDEMKPPQVESWKSLGWDSYYDVNVKHFKNPESFLIVLDTSDNKIHQAAIQVISQSPLTVPLETIDIGVVCAVRGEDITRRCKVVRTDPQDSSVDVLLVDYGEIVTYSKSELFVLPNELITKIPFQTVHCRLMGVRPKYNMEFWPSKQIAAFQKLIRDRGYKTPLKMIVKKKNQRNKDDLMAIGMNSYEVTLADQAGQHLSDVAVSKKFVDEVEFKNPVREEKELDENVEPDDVDLLQAMLEMLNSKESSDDESDEEEDFQDASDEGDVVIPEEEVAIAVPPESSRKANALSYVHKHPMIEWRQNEELIYLLISAIDSKDYGLQLTDTSMTVGIKYIDGRYEKTTLQFYSSVDTAQLSHELRGLNIIVRLFKRNVNNEWPRLTANNERSQFIKYSTAPISSMNEIEALKSSSTNRHPGWLQASRALLDDSTDESDTENLFLSDDDEVDV